MNGFLKKKDIVILKKETAKELVELLDASWNYIYHYLPTEEALIHGFDVDYWCDEVERTIKDLNDQLE